MRRAEKTMPMEHRNIPTPEDYFSFKCPGDPQVSPDGSLVVYGLQERDLEADAVRVNLWLMNLEDGRKRPLTRGDHSDTSPRFSPDGSRIAFLSDRDDETRIWILDVAGGEARRIDMDLTPSGPPVWSPEGDQIAFTARAFYPDEDWIPYPGAPEDDRARALARARDEEGADDVKVITRPRFRFDGKGYFGELRDQLCLVDACPGKEVEPVALAEAPFDRGGPPAFSPDGRYLAYTALETEDAELRTAMDLWAVEVKTGRRIHLLQGMGALTHPLWSPDGKQIAFVGHTEASGPSSTSGAWVFQPDLEAADPLAPADAIELTADLDRPVINGGIASDLRLAPTGLPIHWDPTGESLLFLAADRGATGIHRVDISGEGSVQREVFEEDRVISAFAAAAGRLILQAGSSQQPEEVWLHRDGCPDRCLSRANTDLLEDFAFPAVQSFAYRSEDGLEVEGFVLMPPDVEEGTRVPGVLQIHGGPHGAYGHTFSYLSQMMAGNGMAVIMTNPRGSQTYGSDFARAVVGDWGGGDMVDILCGLDEALERMAIDPDRLGIGGWSYGGFMTSWMLGQSDRFAAGVVGAPVTDRFSFYGTSDIGLTFGEHQCQGMPWEGADALLERSPLVNADAIDVPVLLVHGEDDLRCPVAQSEELFLALKRLGREVALVVYPGESHGIKKPVHLWDRYRRTLAWYEHHLG